MLLLRKYLLLFLLLLSGCSAVDESVLITLDQCQFSLISNKMNAESEPRKWQQMQLPDSWNSSRPDVGGTAIYRFELDLNVAPDRLWALLLPRVGNNAEVHLNGTLLGRHGSFDGYSIIWNTPFQVTIPSGLLRPGKNIIDVKVEAKANYFGRLMPPLIGAQEFIEPRYEQLYFWQIILSEICAVFALTMAICMLMIWWYRKNPLYGWFAFGGISWAFYSLYFIITDLPLPLEYWVRFCFSCSFLMLSSMLVFICHFMSWKLIHKTRWIMTYSLAGILVLILLPDAQIFNGIRWLMAGYALMYSALGFALLNALRFEKSKKHAITSLIGIGANIGLGLHDWANIFFILNQPYLLQYGQPFIFLVMGRHLFKDYISALRQAELTNKELDERVHLREMELQTSMQKSRQAEHEKLLLKERERIMADIHDGVGGHLISALAVAESSTSTETTLVSQTIHQALDELRIVIDSLDPDERKLSLMLGSFRHRYDQRLQKQGIQVNWKFNQLDQLDLVGPEISLQLLRILQELITNIIKHARANQVSVWMGISDHPHGQECWLSVADNGIGFDTTASPGRGLGNLKRRAEAVGGSIKLTSQGKGTIAELVFPMRSMLQDQAKLLTVLEPTLYSTLKN